MLPLLPLPSQSFAPACTALPDAQLPTQSLLGSEKGRGVRMCSRKTRSCVAGPSCEKPTCSPGERSPCGSGCTYRKAPGASSSGLLCPATHTATSLYCDREWLVQHSPRMFLDSAVRTPTCLQVALLLSFCAVISFVSQFLALIFLLSEV